VHHHRNLQSGHALLPMPPVVRIIVLLPPGGPKHIERLDPGVLVSTLTERPVSNNPRDRLGGSRQTEAIAS